MIGVQIIKTPFCNKKAFFLNIQKTGKNVFVQIGLVYLFHYTLRTKSQDLTSATCPS